MAKVTEVWAKKEDQPIFICDFSPPRGADLSYLEPATYLGVDFICVAYNPGKSVRVDSATAAYSIGQHTNTDVIFNLGTRDMNRLALQSHLLGAQMLGLENVIVLRGDEFTEKELSLVQDVDDYTPTGLIAAIKSMNEGIDYKGLRLRSPTALCVGASIDLGRGMEREVRLAYRKAQAGAEFFLMQALYDASQPEQFLRLYSETFGQELSRPVFYGIQILHKDGLVFGDVPQRLRDDLNRDRSGADIALEVLHSFVDSGLRAIYLVPPILRGGRRDYEAAQELLEAFRR